MRDHKPHRRGKAARELALWRLSVIEPALAHPRGAERRMAVARIVRSEIRGPRGGMVRVSRASIYRWMRAFEQGRSLMALEPRPRSDRGTVRTRIPELVIEKALLFLAQDSEVSLPLLIQVLTTDGEIASLLKGAGITKISRSTLQRRLAKNKLYAHISRDRKRAKGRTRWVPRRVHQVWHLDAMGPCSIQATSSVEITFHILSIIDGASRAVIAAKLVLSPNLCATVSVFRTALRMYGLPERFYFDRGSPFDTPAFRGGLGVLGINRTFVKPRNPQPNGKIEAYHRCMRLWFVNRLQRQGVVDLTHLEQLFSAVIEYYQHHTNREIKTSPAHLLGGAVSTRSCPPSVVLEEAFLQPYGALKAHRTTGEIDVGRGRGKHLVPRDLRGRRLEIYVDPDPMTPVFAKIPETGALVQLHRAQVHPDDADPDLVPRIRWCRGILQALYDNWQGKVRPVAEPGFGLNEIYKLLEEACSRGVPRTDGEAGMVLQWYAAHGPFASMDMENALVEVVKAFGRGRPLKAYLDELSRRVVPSDQPKLTRPRRKK